MTMSIEELRRLLASPPTIATANALKEWRTLNRYSQAEGAIRLGVPLRTLQGWELGRPMPYPDLLQRASGVPLQAEDRPALTQSDFPREFAEFIDFLGTADVDRGINKVNKRLAGLPAEVGAIYGDRYFFQQQFLKFVDSDKSPFFLDIYDVRAVRAASLIAGINRTKRSLNALDRERFRSKLAASLALGSDLRQIEHEIRCATHFEQMGFKVTFVDFEKGGFDLLVTTAKGPIEVECKTLSEDTGSQLKKDMAVALAESFFRHAKKHDFSESGLFTMTLRTPSAHCKRLPEQLQAVLSGSDTPYSDFDFTFTPVPKWQKLLDEERIDELQRALRSDYNDGEFSRSVSQRNGRVVAFDVRPHALPDLNQKVIETLKEAADQCTGNLPAIIWLHFNGHPEDEIQQVFEFSARTPGGGLNSTVASALHPDVSSTNRSHVQRVRFSATGASLLRRLTPDSDRMLRRFVSQGGLCFDVPNPLTKFRDTINV